MHQPQPSSLATASAQADPAEMAGPGFEIHFSPAIQPKHSALPPGVYVERELLHPDCVAKGWFLAPDNAGLRGLRAVIGGDVVVAKRKQLRPDVLLAHPSRSDALLSGFTVGFQLKPGVHDVPFQFKDEQGQWHTFCVCRLGLSRWWRFKQKRPRLPANAYEQWCARHATASAADLEGMRSHIARFARTPVISILMPTYNTPEKWLDRVFESVQRQVYPHWELCVADDHSSQGHVRAMLAKCASRDARIKTVFRGANGHICHASNSALELCTGEFTALLDHDDELPPDALYHVAREIIEHPDVAIFFSDEDKIDETGVRFDPYFKPGWNSELLLGQNLVSHLGVFRTSLLREIGGFRPGYEGSQDWDLTLRALAGIPLNAVRHIPRVLYHWRTLPTSTAATMTAKPYALDAARKAVAGHLEQIHSGAVLRDLPDGSWRVIWPLPEPTPLVSIVILAHHRTDLLHTALDTLIRLTSYPRFEIIVVEHESTGPETSAYLRSLPGAHAEMRIVPGAGPFNESRLNHLGVNASSGETVVFLSPDVEIVDSDWLRELVSQTWRPDVGAVGAALLYPGGKLHHAGIVLGMTDLAGHVFRNWTLDVGTFGGGRADLAREVTAVTGACLAVRRASYLAAGGFDAEHLPRNYHDIDLCLKLRALGLRNIYSPFAGLIRHESDPQCGRKAEANEEARILLERWPREFEQDAFYNPNLALDAEVPALGATALPRPWSCPT